MLRFRSTDVGSAAGHRGSRVLARRLRWKLWMLLIALGLVIATMRHLNKPSTANRLGQVFGTTDVAARPEPERQFVLSNGATVPQEPDAQELDDPARSLPSPSASEDTRDAIGRVQDNTYFRPAEHEAWFALLGRLQNMESEEVADSSQGELTYAQLLKQPDVYRGRIVTVSGTLRREEVEQAPSNDIGIETYHRLVIQPRGGGHWPFVVYCLELPAELPRGDDLKSDIIVDGYFFKNWSYAWQDGLGVAPVVLARSVAWQAAAPQTPQQSFSGQSLMAALLIAGGIAAAMVWLAMRNTRRPTGVSTSYEPICFPDAEAADTLQRPRPAIADRENEA